jgi:hypothetical protein
MVRRNIDVALRYHEFVISLIVGRIACGTGGMPCLGWCCTAPGSPSNLHLGPDWAGQGLVTPLSPMAFPAIPGEQQIGEPIICDTGDRPDNWQAEQSPKPDVARRSQPNRDRAINPNVEPILRVEGVQPAPHVVHSDAEGGEHIWFKIDIAKIDRSGSGRAYKPIALPVDASITYGTFSVVPDCEFRDHRDFVFKTCRASDF